MEHATFCNVNENSFFAVSVIEASSEKLFLCKWNHLDVSKTYYSVIFLCGVLSPDEKESFFSKISHFKENIGIFRKCCVCLYSCRCAQYSWNNVIFDFPVAFYRNLINLTKKNFCLQIENLKGGTGLKSRFFEIFARISIYENPQM